MGQFKLQLKNKQLIYGEIIERKDLEENMRMNCIPESIFNMESVDYEEFLKERSRLMAQKIRTFYEDL